MKDNKKKIILCPNPNRDQGMLATKAAEKILRGERILYCGLFPL